MINKKKVNKITFWWKLKKIRNKKKRINNIDNIRTKFLNKS